MAQQEEEHEYADMPGLRRAQRRERVREREAHNLGRSEREREEREPKRERPSERLDQGV